MTVKRGLGKGLDALFESIQTEQIQNPSGELEGRKAATIERVRIMDIDPNPLQPRKHFGDEKIQELAASIKIHGVVQPIVIKPAGGRFLLVAGERRWRAARQAGLNTIPAVVMDLDERQVMEIGLIENLQREDLNPVEEAKGIKLLLDEYRLTQDEIAGHLGKSRPAIANTIRLLNLSESIQRLLEEDKLTAGHARALLALEDTVMREEVAEVIIQKGLNVRETEKLIRTLLDKDGDAQPTKPAKPSYITEIEAGLEESLGTRVAITPGRKKGIIQIEYYSHEDLERIIEKVTYKRNV